MIKKTLGITGLLLSMNLLAQSHVDVYGDKVHGAQIINQYGKQIEQIISNMVKEIAVSSSSTTVSPAIEKLVAQKQALVQKIQKQYGYKFVNFDTIGYPDKIGYYTTIEVVSPKQPERMRFISQPTKPFKGTPKQDVVTQIMEYSSNTIQEFMQTHIDPTPKICPVFHCIGRLDLPKSKPYLRLFNEAAVKQRALILETIKNDPDPQRRGAAVFLVGHFKNLQDLVEVLLPYVKDKDEGVRNNAMRVIGMSMLKAKTTHINIDVQPFIDLLDSPLDTDRNKALLVLLAATPSPESRHAIQELGLDKLLAMLALTQPNNHDIAYQILKTVSGKHFGDKDGVAWAKWAVSIKKSNA